jgi:hypothetical protein
MINITLQSLVEVLTIKNNLVFAIRSVNEPHRRLIVFISHHNDGIGGFSYSKQDDFNYRQDITSRKSTCEPILYYDLEMQMVTAASNNILLLLKDAKKTLKSCIKEERTTVLPPSGPSLYDSDTSDDFREALSV